MVTIIEKCFAQLIVDGNYIEVSCKALQVETSGSAEIVAVKCYLSDETSRPSAWRISAKARMTYKDNTHELFAINVPIELKQLHYWH